MRCWLVCSMIRRTRNQVVHRQVGVTGREVSRSPWAWHGRLARERAGILPARFRTHGRDAHATSINDFTSCYTHRQVGTSHGCDQRPLLRILPFSIPPHETLPRHRSRERRRRSPAGAPFRHEEARHGQKRRPCTNRRPTVQPQRRVRMNRSGSGGTREGGDALCPGRLHAGRSRLRVGVEV